MNPREWNGRAHALWSLSAVCVSATLLWVVYNEELPVWIRLAAGPIIIGVCITGAVVSRRAYDFPRRSKRS